MLEQMTTAGLSELLNTATITLLVGNILYIFYVFAKKRVYYNKLLLTFAIYFFALIVEPINASVKFNVKYGFGILDLLYLGIILYIIMRALLSNNVYFMYNMPWDEFYKIIKEVFRREDVNTYYRDPVIYINDGEASITYSASLFSKQIIIVKIKGLQYVMTQELLTEKILEHKSNFGIARYYYLLINLLITIILLVNAIY